jgi:hypothetical protein
MKIRPLLLSLSLLAFSQVYAATPSDPVAIVDGQPVYGAVMPEGAATPIATALANSDQYTGKAQKFSGRVAKVCQKKGCWMVLADGETSARVMFGRDDFFIPTDTTGSAVVYGTLAVKTLSEATAKHMAKDAGQDPASVTGDTQEFAITASSVLLQPAG